MRPMVCGGAGRRAGALLAGVAALVVSAAEARPLQVEDLLQREELGAVQLAPGGRFLVVEQRGPFATSGRFDFGELNRLFRTRLMIADLAAGSPLQPLIPPAIGTGYQLGSISPDGARAVVFRLSAEGWELGIVALASGHVTWTGLTPEVARVTQTVQWASPTEIVAIVLPAGEWPQEIRQYRRQAELPPRWAASWRGEVSMVAIGGGRHLGTRPPPTAKRIVSVSAETGATRTLASGDFVDLQASPQGDRIALLEEAEDIPLEAGRPVHGVYGLATKRRRLKLLDVRSRRLTAPCPTCDVLDTLLAWSPSGAEVLAFARTDGAPWTEGRLMRIEAASNRVAKVGGDVRPALVLRYERVAAGWLGPDPIVFGRRPGAPRDDWYRLGRKGPIRLTAHLPRPTRDIVIAGEVLLSAADGVAWRIDHRGSASRLSRAAFSSEPRRSKGPIPRTLDGAVRMDALAGLEVRDGRAQARQFGASGVPARGGDFALEGAVLAVSATGAVLDVTSGGGAESLVWRRPDQADVTLAAFNRRLADVDRPKPVAVRHTGPDGQALRSWIFLPPPRPGPPPPLVVVPYPERTYPEPPARIWRDAAIAPPAALIGRGYAVLLPSLPSAKINTGPADLLAERVLAIVDVAARQPDLAGRFDPDRMAIWGHSFGGYAVATILGQTHRFRAGVAVAPATDLVSRHGEFGPARRVYADVTVPTAQTAGWVETLQGDMRAPPWEAPDRYLRNSPLMGAGRIETPLLLAYGEADGSHAAQAEELFSALFRQNKDVLLLGYWGESHLLDSPGNLRDLYCRAFAFLDLYLGPPDGALPVTSAGAPPPRHPEPASASTGPRIPRPPPP